MSEVIAAMAFLGAFLGALMRTLLPAFRKMQENSDFTWDHRYTLTCIYSFLLSLVIAVNIVAGLDVASYTSATLAFVSAFSMAYAANDVCNDLIKSKKTYVPIPKGE